MSRLWWKQVTVTLLAGVLSGLPLPGATQLRPTTVADTELPERSALRVGLAAPAGVFLPLYLAADRTAQSEGLRIELLTFRGGSGLAQALASDSVDVALMALGTVVNLLDTGHEVRVFYGGLSRADNEWFAQPGIGSWMDVRGRRFGISQPGGFFEAMTRHVLRKHGLEAGRDVHLVPVGGSPTALQALVAGRVDVAFLGPPAKWEAQSRGFVQIGTEAAEIAPEWPKNLFVAKQSFLTSHPRTVRALLRAHVRAIRLARNDAQTATQTLIHHLKYEPTVAGLAYDGVVRGFNERGIMSAVGLAAFWDLSIAAGEVSRPLPPSRFLDQRFIDSFDTWAPR